MKRFATGLLLGALSFVPLLQAQDEEKPQLTAKQKVAAQKWTAHQPGRKSQAAAKVQTQRPVPTQPAVQRPPQVNQNVGRIPSATSPRVVNPQVNPNLARNWQNRRNWNNNSGVDRRFYRGTDSSTSKTDWQNRSGNATQWERSRWSNRHNWDRQHRNRAWWRSHYTRFALFGGGYYYWNNGFWYPAYGYDPYFTNYSYDAPLYAYNDQDPGQVIANVQAALNRRGYDVGGIDGTYGPNTRRALLNFQRDNGLPVTGQIDEDTLATLGLR